MNTIERSLSKVIFNSRWLQVPLYIGLIIILAAYAYRFIIELVLLLHEASNIDNTKIMLGVLDLVDVVMIANLLIMVIMGGYQTFVSDLGLHGKADHPEWLDEVDAGSMKVKLAVALIGISSIHLLRTFIDPSAQSNSNVMWQVVIHLTLVVSAIAIALTNRLMSHK
jgi:uncharacterized protein (TIGR00645 family)